MTGQQRFLTALQRRQPDRVPVWELIVNRPVIDALYGNISYLDFSEKEDLDGVTIEWFRSARDFFGMAVDPESRDVIRNDEDNFLDPAGLLWMLTGPEHVVLDRR